MELRKTILIVCEGKASEPIYFEKFRDDVYQRYKALDRINEITIKIDPLPPIEKAENETFNLRQGAKRRRTTTSAVVPTEATLEDNNKAQPKCYVRKAQILGLENNEYSEVWAVYDKDEHPKHAEAALLAKTEINGSIVNIGFTSIAFEFWILLHFERNVEAYSKAMCRLQKDLFFCGSNFHPQDCKGSNCVCGRIVHQDYLEYTANKKDFDFKLYHQKINRAISNALFLHKHYGEDAEPFYERNPYTSLYRLAFKLLHLPIDYHWFDFTEMQANKEVEVRFLMNLSQIEISIKNCTNKTVIVPENSGRLITTSGASTSFGIRLILNIGETKTINSLQVTKPEFVGFEYNNGPVIITEIP